MFLIESFEEYDLLSLRIRGEESLLHLIGIIFYDGICCFDDDFCRAIVFFEVDDERIGIVFLEREDIFDIGSTPAIYPLPVISDDTEIATFAREDADDVILERIGILVFIDHEVLESTMEVFPYFFIFEN
jgi:hypothetical protein